MNAGRPISEDDLHAYVDRALDTARQAEVGAYLGAHPDMSQRIEGFARQRAMLRKALAPVIEEPLPARLNLARMIAAQRRPTRTLWRSAAAAALLLVGGGALGWFGHSMLNAPNGGIAALLREASENYQVYSPDHVRPVEMRSVDGAELVSWVSERLHRPVVVPNLAPSGFRFMGGRLVATPHGAAGMFMYDDDNGTRLVMMMRPMAIEEDAAFSRYEKAGIFGIAWSRDGMGYGLVGAAPFSRLQSIADDVRRQTAEGR